MLEEIRKHNEALRQNILKGFNSDLVFAIEENQLFNKGEIEYDELQKAVYADTAENRRLGRVGQEYHRGKGGKKDETHTTSKQKRGGYSSEDAKAGDNELKRLQGELYENRKSYDSKLSNCREKEKELNEAWKEQTKNTKYGDYYIHQIHNWFELSELPDNLKKLRKEYDENDKERQNLYEEGKAKDKEITEKISALRNKKETKGKTVSFDSDMEELVNSIEGNVYNVGDALSEEGIDPDEDKKAYAESFEQHLTSGKGKSLISDIKNAVKKHGASKVKKHLNSAKGDFSNIERKIIFKLAGI